MSYTLCWGGSSSEGGDSGEGGESGGGTTPSVDYLEVVANEGGTFGGNYLLYSGSTDSTGSVWKHEEQPWYIHWTGSTSGPEWEICTTPVSGTSHGALVNSLAYGSGSSSAIASVMFANPVNRAGYTTTLHRV